MALYKGILDMILVRVYYTEICQSTFLEYFLAYTFYIYYIYYIYQSTLIEYALAFEKPFSRNLNERYEYLLNYSVRA